MKNLTSVQKLLIEKRVNEITNVHNRQTLRSILSGLFKRSDVGNKASEELEDMWGFCPNQDYHDLADSNWN